MEKSFVFNSINGDRRYKAEDFREYFSSFIGNGVFPNPSTNLQIVSNGDMTVTIKSGKAWINGAIYVNTDDLILNIDHADGVLSRVDIVVLRFDNIERNIICKVKKGIFASSPVQQELQRDADAYELCIGKIIIDKGVTIIQQSNITDTRLDSNVCGIVTQTIKEIDTTELYNKLQAYIDERGQDVDNWVAKSTAQWGNDFINWFNGVKGLLDTDIAGALANRILELENIINNLELTSGKIIRPDGSNVEDALLELNTKEDFNKTSISALEQALGANIDTLNQDISTIRGVL